MKRNGFGCLLAAVCLLLAGEVFAQISDVNGAINKAGRQRMLSQRMAKAYFQIGQQVDSERSRKILDASVALFDRQLLELKNYAPTPAIKDTYLRLEQTWIAYKQALMGAAPVQANGRRVLELSDQALALAQEGTQQLEKFSGTTAGHLVNLAGRQRMLSQRMAKLYQALAWNVADAASAASLDKARREFAEAQQELRGAPANTQQIVEALDLVKQQWFFFDNALSQKPGVDKHPAAVVATTSERILEEMEGVVSLYEKLSVK